MTVSLDLELPRTLILVTRRTRKHEPPIVHFARFDRVVRRNASHRFVSLAFAVGIAALAVVTAVGIAGY